MRKPVKSLVSLALVVLACGVGLVSFADEKHGGSTVTVQGEVLDMACYVAHEAKGSEHAKCAQACAKGGQPVGLLAKDGQVYLLYANHEDPSGFESAKQYAGQQVEITGVAAKRGSMNGLEVKAVKAL
jgi:hypothetical protein